MWWNQYQLDNQGDINIIITNENCENCKKEKKKIILNRTF